MFDEPEPPSRGVIGVALIVLGLLAFVTPILARCSAPEPVIHGCALRWADDQLRCEPDPTSDQASPLPAWPIEVALALGLPPDLNRASSTQLQRLRGIGPRRAAAITALRDARGGLCRLDDLLDVKGIGPRTFARLEPLLTLTPDDLPERCRPLSR